MIYLGFYICLRSYVFLFLNKLAEIFFTIWNFASKKYLFLVIHHKVCDISVNTVWNIACLISFSRTKCALLYHLHSKMPQLLFHKFVSALKKNLLSIFLWSKSVKLIFWSLESEELDSMSSLISSFCIGISFWFSMSSMLVSFFCATSVLYLCTYLS